VYWGVNNVGEMKRSKFLKILGLVAVTPIAIAKALEIGETKHIINKRLLDDPDIVKVNTPDGMRWYDYQELEIEKEFEKRLLGYRKNYRALDEVYFNNGSDTIQIGWVSEVHELYLKVENNKGSHIVLFKEIIK
jgi:hypothetical protein